MTGFAAIIRRTATLSVHLGGGFTGAVFLLGIVTAVPFGLGPDMPVLARVAPAILWIGALLATLLGLDRLFQDDRDDGTLDLLALSSLPLELAVLAKAIGHWLATGLPLVIAAPFLGLLFGLDGKACLLVGLTLLVGTPGLTLLGTIGAALMVALRRGGMLVAVLVLPFCIPILIFGVAAILGASAEPAAFRPPFLLLSALSLVSAVVAPLAGAAALRAGLE
jgi:heme exporter protein B